MTCGGMEGGPGKCPMVILVVVELVAGVNRSGVSRDVVVGWSLSLSVLSLVATAAAVALLVLLGLGLADSGTWERLHLGIRVLVTAFTPGFISQDRRAVLQIKAHESGHFRERRWLVLTFEVYCSSAWRDAAR